MATNLSENVFGTIIKKENLPSVPNKYHNSEDYIEEILVDEDNISTCESDQENTKLLITRQHKKNIQQVSKSSIRVAHYCSDKCVRCKTSFAQLDNANHIGQLRNLDKLNAFLKIKPILKIDSCLCDRCWKYLEKTYKFNKKKKVNIFSSTVNVPIEVEKHSVKESNTVVIKPTTQSSKNFKTRNCQNFSCSIHKCKREVDLHPLSIIEYTKINELLLKADVPTIILVKSDKWGFDEDGPIYSSVCEEHLHMIRVLTSCQLCGNELDKIINTDNFKMYDQWNCTLRCNNIPLKLTPGMFLCDTCQSVVSNSEFFSTINLEDLRQNVKDRNDVCMKLFKVPNTVQRIQFDRVFKVKFAEPLVTSTFFYKPCYNYQSKKRKKKINDHKVNGFSDSLTYSTFSSNANIKLCNSGVNTSDFVNDTDEPSPSVIENPYAENCCDVIPKLEPINEETDIKAQKVVLINEELNSLLKNNDENYQTSIHKYSKHIPHNTNHYSRPNKRVQKLMSLVKKNNELEHIKISSIVSMQNKENSPVSLTKHNADLIFDTIENHSDNSLTNQNYESSRLDIENNLLLVPSNKFDNDDIEMFEDEKTNSDKQIYGIVLSPSKYQSMCRAINEKIDDCNPMTISQPLVQSNRGKYSTNYDEIKKKTESASQHNNADQIDSSSGSDNNNESGKKSIFIRKDFKEFDQNINVTYSSRSDSLRVKSKVIKNGLHNDVCEIIKETKKQRLNDTLPNKSDNRTNSSYMDIDENSSVEPYKHDNNNLQTPNLPSISSLISQDTNENMFNCDYSDDEGTNMCIDLDNTQNISSDRFEDIIESNDSYDVLDIFSDGSEELIMSDYQDYVQNTTHDEGVESIKPIDLDQTSDLKDPAEIQYISSDEESIMSNDLNYINNFSLEEPSFRINSVCSLVPKLKCNQTLIKIPNYIDENQFQKNGYNRDENKTPSDDEYLLVSSESQDKVNKFPCIPKVNIYSVQPNKNDNFHELRFEIKKSNEFIYKDLLAKFGDPSAVISYLMENERLLFSGKLVVSNTANQHAANYLEKHLDVMKKWYGDPEDNDLSESFIDPSYPEPTFYSQRLSSDINNFSKSEETFDNIICSPSLSQNFQLQTPVKSKSDKKHIKIIHMPSSQNLHSLPSNSYNSINSVTNVQEKVTSPIYSPCVPLISTKTVNEIPPVSMQLRPPNVKRFAPNFKVLQRPPAPLFPLLTTVRSKTNVTTRPFVP